MRLCLDRRVLFALGAVALAVLVFAPDALGRAFPILAVAACPLSMLLMMGAMSGARSQDTSNSGVNEAPTAEALEQELAELQSRQADLEARLTARGFRATAQPSVPGVPE